MLNVACLMMQKNERLLLEAWILHHADLFGYNSLFIYDNGSTDQMVVDVLKQYESKGVTVYREFSTSRDFDCKGKIIGERIRLLQSETKFDFYFPMDCDEFIAVATNNEFSVSRKDINEYLDSKTGSTLVLKVTHCLMNIPGSIDVHALLRHSKSIIPKTGFIEIDHGFHEGCTVSGKDWYPCDIVYLHMHNKPFKFLLSNAKDKLAPYVDTTDMEKLRDFNGVGNHLVKYFFDYEEKYYDSFYYAPRIRDSSMRKVVSKPELVEFEETWHGGAPTPSANASANVFLPQPIDARHYAEVNGIGDGQSALLIQCYLHEFKSERNPQPIVRQNGLNAIAARNWTLAAGIWETYRSICPSDPEGYSMGVLSLREGKDIVAAEQLATSAMILFPNNYRLFLEWSLITFPTRNWEEARTRFKTMRERYPDQTEGYVRGSTAARELNLVHEAQALLASAMHRFPDNAEMSITYAHFIESKGEWTLARELWSSIADRFPDHPAIHPARERLHSHQ